MEEYLIHITTEGDRWDLLAYRYYGDAVAYEPIVRANPGISPLRGLLPSGLRLRIPVLDEADLEPVVSADAGGVPWL